MCIGKLGYWRGTGTQCLGWGECLGRKGQYSEKEVVLDGRELSKEVSGGGLWRHGSKGYRRRENFCPPHAVATPFPRISPGKRMQSAVPFLSQRQITCPCPHSPIHSLPCHLLSPKSHPPEHFLSPSLPAQVTNTCPGAHHFRSHPPHALTLALTLEGVGVAGVRQRTGDRGAITRGLLLPLSTPHLR